MEKNLSNFENIKANSIKIKHSISTTLSTNLLESSITVIEDKAFIGFTEKDKENIITAKTTYSVAKGTIDKLNQYGDVTEVMEAVKPVVALKNVEVIKG